MLMDHGLIVDPMTPLPLRTEDPRLDGWYHTIELAPGVFTRGVFDHRDWVDQVGLPRSLKGKTALDVGTADGFWAFEMERRGADRVTAIDVACLGDCDHLPAARARLTKETRESQSWPERFATAHRARRSNVYYKICNVYNLSPEAVGGMFDVVYCGDLLLHLKNPLQALINIRSVTKEMAVVVTGAIGEDVEARFPDRPYMRFGHLHAERLPGDNNVYWEFSIKALCDMLVYAGFSDVRAQPKLYTPTRHPGAPPVYPAVAAVGRV
jgi:tRNA (mo5U34)-methyltransferase